MISLFFLLPGCATTGSQLARIEKVDLGPRLNARVGIYLTGENVSAVAKWSVPGEAANLRFGYDGNWGREGEWVFQWEMIPYPYLKEALMSGAGCVFKEVKLINNAAASAGNVEYILYVNIDKAKADVLPGLHTRYRHEVYTSEIYCTAKLVKAGGYTTVESREFHSQGSGDYDVLVSRENIGDSEATAEAARKVALEILNWAHAKIKQ
jgi:hypothetical protein